MTKNKSAPGKSHSSSPKAVLIAYAVLMIVVVVAADLMFFRHRFRARLVANILIVLVFIAGYLLILRRHD